MNTKMQYEIEKRLALLVKEMGSQPQVGDTYDSLELPFLQEICQLKEYIEMAGEYEIAYESIVSSIQKHSYTFSSKAMIAILELALLFCYKTNLDEDAMFDKRSA